MEEVLIKDLFRDPDSYLHRHFHVSGWVRTLRVSKTFGFIELNDGSFFRNLQVVFTDNLPNFEEVAKLPIATALRIEGQLVESPGAKQPWEMQATGSRWKGFPIPITRCRRNDIRWSIYGPLPTSDHGQYFSAVFRLRSLAAYAIHRFFQGEILFMSIRRS